MRRNLENQYQTLYSDYRILTALRELDSLGFREIHRKTGGSQRTLWEHLKKLRKRRAVRKLQGKYLITDVGLAFIERLERQVKMFQQYKKHSGRHNSRSYLVDRAVEVTRIERSGFICIGTINVSMSRTLQPEQRQELDRTLTDVMRRISARIPEGVKEYEVTIAGTLTGNSGCEPKIAP